MLGGAVIKNDDNNADDLLNIVKKLELLRVSAPDEYGYIKGFINRLAMKNCEDNHGKKRQDDKKEENET